VVLGTNPITLAAPGQQDNFVLDMATSAVALGKVISYIQLLVSSCIDLLFHCLCHLLFAMAQTTGVGKHRKLQRGLLEQYFYRRHTPLLRFLYFHL